MGYETDFNFVEASEEFIEALNKKLNEYYVIEDDYLYAKWYDYEKDCKEVSLLFPEETILLEGKGEDYDDFWRCYFKNGKSAWYKGKVVYPIYKEEDLL